MSCCFARACCFALLRLDLSHCLGLPFFALLRFALFALSSFSQRLVVEYSERVYALIGCAHLVLHALGGVVATHTFCHLRIQFEHRAHVFLCTFRVALSHAYGATLLEGYHPQGVGIEHTAIVGNGLVVITASLCYACHEQKHILVALYVFF